MVLALTLVIVRISMEGVDACPGTRLFELGAEGGGENRSAEDTANVVTDQKLRTEGAHRFGDHR